MPELSKIIELFLVALAVALITRRTRPYTIALVIVALVLGLARTCRTHAAQQRTCADGFPPAAAAINLARLFEWLRGERPKDTWVSPFLTLALQR
jgi:hypothetical protein